MGNGNFDLSTESLLERHLLSLTAACVGRGRRVSGTLKLPGRTCLSRTVHLIYLLGSLGKMKFSLEYLLPMLKIASLLRMQR